MQYRRLGHTGLIVSELALGSMQFGGKMNMGNLGQQDTTQMVKRALDHGINLFDTADVYSLGESETLLGNALKGIRQEIVLATKVRLPMSANFNRSGATRVNIMRTGSTPEPTACSALRPVRGVAPDLATTGCGRSAGRTASAVRAQPVSGCQASAAYNPIFTRSACEPSGRTT